jgi:hypothetical protein
MFARLALAGLAFLATLALAEDAPWPPPANVEARMHELQAVMGSRESTPEQRAAAREELINLLKSPAGQRQSRPAEEKPARAAIEPFPRIVKPAENPTIPSPGVAHVEVVSPPKTIVVPQTGSVVTPSGRFAVDPRTGSVLHEIPGGYIDPRTGQVVPR